MAAKTNTGLVAYAKSQIGKPYWFGTFGQAGSSSLLTQKARQYPAEYTATIVNNSKKQFGEKVHDCIGLIKGYLWSDSPTDTTPTYNVAQDLSANGMYNACRERGYINTMPDVAGVLVFMSGHVGVYIGNGEVVEAMNANRGVVKTKLAGRGWQRWGKCPFITYTSAAASNSASSGTSTATKKKTIEEVAKDVLAGKYGNGEERVKKLKAEGYDPDEVQDKVNELLEKGNKGTATKKKTIEEVAKDVLAGKYGNGEERVKKLKAEGYDPDKVQDKVNELLEKGNKSTATKKPTKGAKVKITGKYASSSTAKSAGNSRAIGNTAYIVDVYEGRAFPYQLGTKKGDTSNANTIGFAKASAFKLV